MLVKHILPIFNNQLLPCLIWLVPSQTELPVGLGLTDEVVGLIWI